VAFLGTRLSWKSYSSGTNAALIPPVFAPVDQPEQFEEAFAIVPRERADTLLVSHGPVMYFGVPRIVAFAA
jgi:hypothetical protein